MHHELIVHELNAVGWDEIGPSDGDHAETHRFLNAMVSGRAADRDLRAGLECFAYRQGVLFPESLYAVPFLLASLSLDSARDSHRFALRELLNIANGVADKDATVTAKRIRLQEISYFRTAKSERPRLLQVACRHAVAEELPLLFHMIRSLPNECFQDCLDLIGTFSEFDTLIAAEFSALLQEERLGHVERRAVERWLDELA